MDWRLWPRVMTHIRAATVAVLRVKDHGACIQVTEAISAAAVGNARSALIG